MDITRQYNFKSFQPQVYAQGLQLHKTKVAIEVMIFLFFVK